MPRYSTKLPDGTWLRFTPEPLNDECGGSCEACRATKEGRLTDYSHTYAQGPYSWKYEHGSVRLTEAEAKTLWQQQTTEWQQERQALWEKVFSRA